MQLTPRPSAIGAPLASIFGHALCEAGVSRVYGMPGGGNNLDLIGAAEDHGLRFVLAHGETAAAIMAAVDGELTEVPGACLVTRGPGAASAVNGVAHALLDRAPLVLISDDVSSVDRARISHQYVDQCRLFAPITKWSGRVGLAGGAEVAISALALAASPPPGPVHLVYDPDAPRTEPPSLSRPRANQPLVEASRLLRASRSPVFALGVGSRPAVGAIRELLRTRPWPTLTTYKAKGAIPEQWGNAAGLLTGGTRESRVLQTADLIVAIGLDPVELIPAPWPYRAPVLALGEWPLSHRYFDPAVELVGPVDELVALVATELAAVPDGEPEDRASRLRDDLHLCDTSATGIAPHDIVLAARATFPTETIATVDSGAHMLVVMPLWEVQELDEIAISSGLATMGFAIPAAIAAALAKPDRRVVCFVGDGGLGMTLAELETVARLDLPVTVIVFNDSALSLIEIKQRDRGHGGQDAVRYRATDFSGIAAGIGIRARRVASASELVPALLESQADRHPFLLDVDVDPSGYREIMAATRG